MRSRSQGDIATTAAPRPRGRRRAMPEPLDMDLAGAPSDFLAGTIDHRRLEGRSLLLCLEAKDFGVPPPFQPTPGRGGRCVIESPVRRRTPPDPPAPCSPGRALRRSSTQSADPHTAHILKEALQHIRNSQAHAVVCYYFSPSLCSVMNLAARSSPPSALPCVSRRRGSTSDSIRAPWSSQDLVDSTSIRAVAEGDADVQEGERGASPFDVRVHQGQ